MATKNDITGDSLISKASTDAYCDGWERIFGKKELFKTFEDGSVYQMTQPHPLDSEDDLTQLLSNEIVEEINKEVSNG